MVRRVLNITGRVLLGLGILLLLFTAYQLWGTGLAESHSQSILRNQLDKELPPGAAAQAARIAAHPPKAKAGSGPARTAPTTATPAEGQPVGTIQIPSIGLDQVVVQGVATGDLQMGPGHYPGTPLPGQLGNAAVAGHRTTYAHPFFDLNEVTPGTRIVITTTQGVFVYTATAQTVVSPSDVSVIGPSPKAQLTLTTCNPRYSASQRLVVKATLTSSTLFSPRRSSNPGGYATTTTTTTAPTHRQLAGTGLAGEAATTSVGRWVEAALLALATAAVGILVWLLARRVRHPWAVYLPGAVAVLAVLFVFFMVLSPLLPASY